MNQFVWSGVAVDVAVDVAVAVVFGRTVFNL